MFALLPVVLYPLLCVALGGLVLFNIKNLAIVIDTFALRSNAAKLGALGEYARPVAVYVRSGVRAVFGNPQDLKFTPELLFAAALLVALCIVGHHLSNVTAEVEVPAVSSSARKHKTA